MTPEQEQRALECPRCGRRLVEEWDGDREEWVPLACDCGLLPDEARLHAARLRVVEAAKEWRNDENSGNHVDALLVDAVDALEALEKEADRG